MNLEEIKVMVNSGEMYDDAHQDVAALRNKAIAMCFSQNSLNPNKRRLYLLDYYYTLLSQYKKLEFKPSLKCK